MLHLNAQTLGRYTFLFAGSLTIGLLAIAATPAFAGSGTFSKTGSMSAARVGHTATLLANGEVLVAGGTNNTTGYLSSAELYNPSTGKWTLTGSMTAARVGHEAVLLQNGDVLVAGGYNGSGGITAPPLASAEVFNAATGIWRTTGSMTAGREDFILTLLPNGEVLAAGGDDNGTVLTSAELYNPATGTWAATASMAAGSSGATAVLLQNCPGVYRCDLRAIQALHPYLEHNHASSKLCSSTHCAVAEWRGLGGRK